MPFQFDVIQTKKAANGFGSRTQYFLNIGELGP
jgi:hypothetical protein